MKKADLVLRAASAFVVAVVAVACSSAPPTIQTGPDVELSFDGLHKVDNSLADTAWARPDFDISGYTKIWLVDAGIEYRQVKDRGRTAMARSRGGPYFMDDKTRTKFEELVAEVFRDELQKIQGFELVDAAGPDVLMVRGGLLDVASNVPPDMISGRSEVYLSYVGAATLVLELYDSESSTILARSVDRRAAESPGGQMRFSSSVTNAAEVRRLIRRWATRLREGLEGFSQRPAG